MANMLKVFIKNQGEQDRKRDQQHHELVLAVNRESSAEELRRAYRKLSLKTHPDKGGKQSDQQKLQKAKDAWEKAVIRVCDQSLQT